jgi:hypothetical protein
LISQSFLKQERDIMNVNELRYGQDRLNDLMREAHMERLAQAARMNHEHTTLRERVLGPLGRNLMAAGAALVEASQPRPQHPCKTEQMPHSLS